MHVQAPSNPAEQQNEITLARVQNAVESAHPCIITSPPSFGQLQLLRQIALNLGRETFHVQLNDFELTDPSKLRSIIASLSLTKADAALALTEELDEEDDAGQSPDNKKRALLIIEHDFTADSVQNLLDAKKSYGDAISLNRIDQVLPILCSPLTADLLTAPKKTDAEKSELSWLFVQPHELLTPMPLGTQQLLNSAPPHLHQSLLGITRLAESWPSMSALLTAKLRGLGAHQELKGQKSAEDWHLYGDIGELQIPSQALKTTCSELLNNYQAIMGNLADQLLSHQEQMLLAHLSLFPPNIHPFLPFLAKNVPEIHNLVQSLHLKSVLVERHDTLSDAPQSTLLSFANLAWRFFAQGYLRRTCAAASIDTFINETLNAILENTGDNAEWVMSLAIEFALSSKEYERAIELIIQQAQVKSEPNIDKMQRINQAVNWFKFIPQRLINLNPQARVIQSYHRLVADQNLIPGQQSIIAQTTSDPVSTSKLDATPSTMEGSSALLRNIGGATKATNRSQDYYQPRLSTSDGGNAQESVPVSLQEVEIPKHSIRPTQASLLLDIQKHVEEQNLEQISLLSQNMIERAFNQQKPELFLHGLSYAWYYTQLTDGAQGFVIIVDQCLEDSRLSTHLSEFRYWLNQLSTSVATINKVVQGKQTPTFIVPPNMPHLSSLGQNVLGYMTSFLNAMIAISHCDAHLASERAQEATYFAMNLPDIFGQTLMPLWLVETLSFLQQNLIHQAITFLQNTVNNSRLGSLRINNPMLGAFERLIPSEEGESIKRDDAPTVRLQLLHQQLESISLLWQHSYKKSDRVLVKLLKQLEQENLKNTIAFPWIWFGPTSWYLLKQRLNEHESKGSKNSNLELQLKHMELYYEPTYEFDSAYLSLSKRETEILGLVVSGCSNEEISNLLCRSLGTIKLHVHSIYKKLSVSNRVNAIKKCQTSGFFGFGV